jgi:hypothetical protein
MATTAPNLFALAIESFIADIKREEDIKSPFYREVLAHIYNGSSLDDQRKRSEESLAQFIQELSTKQKHSSKTIKISEKLRPFVSGLSQYTSACDVAVQAAPSAAVLLYSGARIVLQLAEKFYNCFESVLSIMEEVGHLLDCYHIFSKAYEKSADMQRLLVETYKNIVSFWLKASKLFSKRPYKTLLSGVVKPLDAEWQRCRQALQEDRKRVQTFAQATEADLRRQREEKEATRQQNRIRSQIIDWIKGGQEEDKLDVRHDMREHFEIRCQDTCGWLFEHPEMEKWLRAKKSVAVWYSAGPGAGKTITSSAVARRLQDDERRVATFFCIFNDQVRRKSITVFRSLALQLLGPKDPIPEKVKKLYEDDLKHHCAKLTDLKAAAEVVEALLKQQPRVHIIVDGLDECEDRQQLLQILCHLLHSKMMGIVKWFFASRPDADIRVMMRKHSVIEVVAPQENLMADIRRYLTGRGTLHCSGCIDHWTTLSEGNFLWMAHMLPVIEGETSTCTEEIEEELEKFPKGLSGAYARSLTQLLGRPALHQHLARKIFSMVVGAIQPLRLSELTHALAASKGMADYSVQRLPKRELIEELCSNLIIFDRHSKGTQDDPLLKVAHKSVQDFFLQDPNSLSLPDNNLRDFFVTGETADLELGQAAIFYLSYTRYQQPQVIASIIEDHDHAFLRHAAVFWYRYLRGARHTKALAEKVTSFVQSEAFWTCTATQIYLAPHLFARYRGRYGCYSIEATGIKDETDEETVNYATPLPDWLELDEYAPAGSRVVEALHSFVTEWHPVLNSHPAALDQCIMDFDWQMMIPGRIVSQSKQIRMLSFRKSASLSNWLPLSVADTYIKNNEVIALTVEHDLISKMYRTRWTSLKTTLAQASTEKVPTPLLANSSVNTTIFSPDNNFTQDYWAVNTRHLSAQLFHPTTHAEGFSTPETYTSNRAGGTWKLISQTINYSSASTSPMALVAAFHCTLEQANDISNSDILSTQDSGYVSQSNYESHSDSDSDSGSTYDVDTISSSTSNETPAQSCMFIIRDSAEPLWHYWNSSSKVNIEAPCAFHPTEPLAVWSPSAHEICLMNLSSKKAKSTILPEPVNAQFLSVLAMRKEFHFSRSQDSGGATMYYLLYTGTRDDTCYRHTIYVSTFLFSRTDANSGDYVFERTQPTQTIQYECASPIQHPLILTYWTTDYLYVALPSLSCNPKMLQMRIDQSETTNDYKKQTAKIQTLRNRIYFPYSTPYRNPQLRILRHRSNSSQRTLHLLLNADFYTSSSSYNSKEPIRKPPAVLAWDLNTQDWRAWDDLVDGKDKQVVDNDCVYKMLRGTFVDEEREFQVPVRSGLDWRRKAFLSCA